MIDFNNPFRPEIEKILFTNPESVDNMFTHMADVLDMLVNGNLTEELVSINKDFIRQCLSYEAIQQDGRDLSSYTLVI